MSSYLEKKVIEVDVKDIEGCHPLPTKYGQPPTVIMRFISRKNKTAVLKQGHKLKGTNVYINEH